MINLLGLLGKLLMLKRAWLTDRKICIGFMRVDLSMMVKDISNISTCPIMISVETKSLNKDIYKYSHTDFDLIFCRHKPYLIQRVNPKRQRNFTYHRSTKTEMKDKYHDNGVY